MDFSIKVIEVLVSKKSIRSLVQVIPDKKPEIILQPEEKIIIKKILDNFLKKIQNDEF